VSSAVGGTEEVKLNLAECCKFIIYVFKRVDWCFYRNNATCWSHNCIGHIDVP